MLRYSETLCKRTAYCVSPFSKYYSESVAEIRKTVCKLSKKIKRKLNNGLVVKLLGVASKPEYYDQAIEFLQQKFQKRKVYLKYDTVKYDEQNTLLCYVYPDNKKFINNHLI